MTVSIVSPTNSVVETINLKIRMTTIRNTNGVYYSVEVRPGSKWVTIWSDAVRFGRDAAHRTGGYAFRAAAKAQEDRATFEAAVMEKKP